MPSGALHGNGHAEECAQVGDGTVQLLEVHVQRLALGTARLLVQADTLDVETFENRFIEELLRVGCVRGTDFEFDAADEI